MIKMNYYSGKFFRLFIAMFFVTISMLAFSEQTFANIKSVVDKNNLTESATVAISVKDVKSGKILYQINEKKLLHPASTLKIFTTKAAVDALGYDYNFVTAVYKDNSNNLYIKLSGNPLFTTNDLKILLADAKTKLKKNNVKTIYVDDSALDRYNWGIGWMWDDNVNSLMPKFSAYNINGNIQKLNVAFDKNGNITVATIGEYKLPIISLLKKGSANKIVPVRENGYDYGITYLNGTIATPTTLTLPVINPQNYFLYELRKTLKSVGISANSGIIIKNVPAQATLISKSEQCITPILKGILTNSNNFYAETLFKSAGGKYANTAGSVNNAIDMFKNYYNKNGLNVDSISVVDGSGVSRNNLITADWMSSSLVKIANDADFAKFKDFLATPESGTLKNRFLDFEGTLNCKTGSLSGVSAISGYVTTKKNNDVAFSVLVQNFNIPTAEVKKFEDELIYEIYQNY